MLAQSELTARHISRKIARHFLSDDPSPEVVSDLASAYQRSGGHLPEVYAALLSRPEVTAPLGKKARNGREFVLAALRACTIPSKYWNGSSGVRLSMGALTHVRQPYWDAPSPKGWPEEKSYWFSPVSLAGRLKSIPLILQHSTDNDIEGFAERALGANLNSRTVQVASRASTRAEALGLVLASPEFSMR